MKPVKLLSVTFVDSVSIDQKMHVKYSSGPALKLSLFGGYIVAERKDKGTMIFPASSAREMVVDGKPVTAGEIFSQKGGR